jgi:hypothetical protein
VIRRTPSLVYFDDGDLRTLMKDERRTQVKAAADVRGLPAVTILSRRLSGDDT